MSPASRLSSGTFKGFSGGKVKFARLPAQFFTDLLPKIDQLGELKVTLYALWFLDRMEGGVRYLRVDDFTQDEHLAQSLGPDPSTALAEALAQAVKRGTLLKVELPGENGIQAYYFLNSPRGRAAWEAAARGDWHPSGDPQHPIALDADRPNIYRLYEEHIGPLSPMIAEELKEAEEVYPAKWIEDAMRIAVENNVHRWRYVQAILQSWQEKGRDGQDRRDTEKDRRRYTEGPYADFIEH